MKIVIPDNMNNNCSSMDKNTDEDEQMNPIMDVGQYQENGNGAPLYHSRH